MVAQQAGALAVALIGDTSGVRKAVDSTIKDVERLGTSVSQVGKKLEETGKKMESTGKKLSLFLTAPLVAFGGFAVKAAGEAERFRSSLEGLAGGADQAQQFIDKIKEVSLGTISALDAMAVSNKALTLGVVDNADAMAKLTEIAIVLGRAQGLTATQAVDDLTTALGRQSPLILDNLGITLKLEEAYKIYADQLGKSADELSDAEKSQAFLNAAMAKGEEVVSRLGGITDDAAAKTERMNASLDDMKVEVGELLAPVVGQFIDTIRGWIQSFLDLDTRTQRIIITIAALAAGVGPLLILVGKLTSAVGTLFTTFAAHPIGALITALAAIGVAFYTLWSTCEGFRDFWIGFWDSLKLSVEVIVNGIIAAINWMIDGINAAISLLNKIPFINIGEVGKLGDIDLTPVVVASQDLVDAVGDAASDVVRELGFTGVDIVAGLDRTIGTLRSSLEGEFEGLATTLEGIGSTIDSAGKSQEEILQAILDEYGKGNVARILTEIASLEDTRNGILAQIELIQASIPENLGSIEHGLSGGMLDISGTLDQLFDLSGRLNDINADILAKQDELEMAMHAAATTFETSIAGGFLQMSGDLDHGLTGLSLDISGFLSEAVEEMRVTYEDGAFDIVATIGDSTIKLSSVIEALKATTAGKLEGLGGKLGGLLGSLTQIGSIIFLVLSILDILGVDMTQFFEQVGRVLGGIWDAIKSVAKFLWEVLKVALAPIIIIGKVLASIVNFFTRLLGGGKSAEGITVPTYDVGGVVAGALGQPQLIVAHGGETILRPGESSINYKQLADAVYAGVRDGMADVAGSLGSGGRGMTLPEFARLLYPKLRDEQARLGLAVTL